VFIIIPYECENASFTFTTGHFSKGLTHGML
jgi:hypothetical protein